MAAAGKKLAANVYVGGVLYTPDDEVPADVAKEITNPKAWGDDPKSEGKAPAKPAASGKAEN